MRTILCALCVAAILAWAAPTQAQNINLMGANSMKLKTQDEVDAEKQRNSDYQDAMKKLPDHGTSAKRDPWGTMRSSPQGDPKSTQKTTQKSNQKTTTHTTAQ